MNKTSNEFIFFGMNMPKIGFIYSLLLILWGLVVSIASNSSSLTSYIPTFVGIPILLFSLASIFQPKKQKIFMHIVVLFGLISFLGGFTLLTDIFSGKDPFSNYWVSTTKLMMLTTGVIFSILCFQSFRFARKNKFIDTEKR